jgi:hypothetical protein
MAFKKMLISLIGGLVVGPATTFASQGSDCRFLLFSEPELRHEIRQLIDEAHHMNQSHFLKGLEEELGEAMNVLLQHAPSEDPDVTAALDAISRLKQRASAVEKLFPVVISKKPVAVFETDKMGDASKMMKKIKARVFEVRRLNEEKTLIAYATELSVEALSPYDFLFAKAFQGKNFFPKTRAYENKQAYSRFVEDLTQVVGLGDKRELLKSEVSLDVYKAFVVSQPTDTDLLETLSYRERLVQMIYLPFLEAREADFLSPRKTSPIVDKVLEMVK